MTDRELMQQALKALELLAKGEHPATNFTAKTGGRIYPHRIASDAASALREQLAQPSADEVIASHAKRLALELEGVLLECHDTSATSKWWNSAYQAIHNFHDDINWLYPQDHVSPLGKD